MNILGTTAAGDDLEQQALAEIRSAGRNDWRAAAWLLEHHPTTRMRYHDIARTLADRSQIVDRVIKAATAAGLSADMQLRFLEALETLGLPAAGEEQ